jgi:hypothetical protein
MLIASIFGTGDVAIIAAIDDLTSVFGRLEYLSEIMAFSWTDYYQPEMGGSLIRRFIAFSDLVSPDALSDIKGTTNEIEQKMAVENKRVVNIDPGLLSAERMVLATGKNYAHRIYLKNGIYADLTLVFKGGEFKPLPWTYLDYATVEIREMFGILRKRYLLYLRH